MLTKILLTLAVIVGAALVVRGRMERRPGVRAAGAPAARPGPPLHLRLLPYGLVLAALSIGALFYWLEWREEHRLFTVRVIDTRASLLKATKVIEGVALDKYLFIRDAYLQRRRGQVYDGNAPPDYDDD